MARLVVQVPVPAPISGFVTLRTSEPGVTFVVPVDVRLDRTSVLFPGPADTINLGTFEAMGSASRPISVFASDAVRAVRIVGAVLDGCRSTTLPHRPCPPIAVECVDFFFDFFFVFWLPKVSGLLTAVCVFCRFTETDVKPQQWTSIGRVTATSESYDEHGLYRGVVAVFYTVDGNATQRKLSIPIDLHIAQGLVLLICLNARVPPVAFFQYSSSVAQVLGDSLCRNGL